MRMIWAWAFLVLVGCDAPVAEAPTAAVAAPTRNVATTELPEARAYATTVFGDAKALDAALPKFDQHYALLRTKLQSARNIPRIEMPVIEPTDMEEFDRRLREGHLDIFPPHAAGKVPAVPATDAERSAWVTLGVKDGDPADDVVQAQWTTIAARDLLPLQSQIWLEKLIGNIKQFGPPTPDSSVLQTTVIVSKEGYILDGHHRFGQVMLADPDLKLKALHIPLDIDTLLRIGRGYGTAIGNAAKK
jgi:hypothetical protein